MASYRSLPRGKMLFKVFHSFLYYFNSKTEQSIAKRLDFVCIVAHKIQPFLFYKLLKIFIFYYAIYCGKYCSGPGCSKLTTSLVNVSLKFQSLISNICQYILLKNVRSFCSAKASPNFSIKNINGFGYKFVKHLTS